MATNIYKYRCQEKDKKIRFIYGNDLLNIQIRNGKEMENKMIYYRDLKYYILYYLRHL